MKFIIVVLLAVAASAKVRYDGNEVWRVHFNSVSELESVRETVINHGIDVWSRSPKHVDIRIDPNSRIEMDSTFSKMGVSYDVMIADVQSLIDAESKTLGKQARVYNSDDYNTLADIEQHLYDIASSSDQATIYVYGSTIEGRDMTQIQFSNGPGKSAIWIDCGIHSREWISPATCLYGVDQLANGNPDFTSLLDAYDIHITAVSNPDGYEHTFNVDRMWRKNRRDNAGSNCIGVDLNRNFDSNFGGDGSSALPCADTYHGASAFSEPETQAIRDAIIAGNYAAAYSVHAYSQLWMYPYGYSLTPPADFDLLDANAAIGEAALEAVHGTQYERGSIADIIYVSSGGSIDWTYDTAGITYSFALELRDQGQYGFLLPSEQITPTGEETWAGMIAAIRAM